MAHPCALITKVSQTSEKCIFGSRLVTSIGTAAATLELRRSWFAACRLCIVSLYRVGRLCVIAQPHPSLTITPSWFVVANSKVQGVGLSSRVSVASCTRLPQSTFRFSDFQAPEGVFRASSRSIKRQQSIPGWFEERCLSAAPFLDLGEKSGEPGAPLSRIHFTSRLY